MTQRGTRVVLFVVAVLIWGGVIYRLLPRSADIPQVDVQPEFDREAAPVLIAAPHVMDYADPFGVGVVSERAAYASPAVRVSPPPVRAPAIDWAAVRLVGVMDESALLEFPDGEVRMLSAGAAEEGATLIRVSADSVLVSTSGGVVVIRME